jgi:hypothetical protein
VKKIWAIKKTSPFVWLAQPHLSIATSYISLAALSTVLAATKQAKNIWGEKLLKLGYNINDRLVWVLRRYFRKTEP